MQTHLSQSSQWYLYVKTKQTRSLCQVCRFLWEKPSCLAPEGRGLAKASWWAQLWNTGVSKSRPIRKLSSPASSCAPAVTEHEELSPKTAETQPVPAGSGSVSSGALAFSPEASHHTKEGCFPKWGSLKLWPSLSLSLFSVLSSRTCAWANWSPGREGVERKHHLKKEQCADHLFSQQIFIEHLLSGACSLWPRAHDKLYLCLLLILTTGWGSYNILEKCTRWCGSR